MAVSAFCPAYATGLFCIGDKDAAGAGFALDIGMATSVSEVKGRSSITINGMESPAPVSINQVRHHLILSPLAVYRLEGKQHVQVIFKRQNLFKRGNG